jgi:DNA-binding NtrC family response regulator
MQAITHGSILAVFFTASQAEIQEGAEWYNTANRTAKTIAETYGVSISRVAGIIAALSPNNRWHKNVRDAENLIKLWSVGADYQELKVSTYNANKRKAIAILLGNDPLEELGGFKVRAFYGCIMGHDDVCIDGHAFSIWSGQRVATSKTPTISAKLYNNIASDYQKATVIINEVVGKNYTAAQVQAITWVTWRNLVKEVG